ncbi:MAG TPA: ABC transporter permease [Ktedonobacteraceae bacterium]|nr:ABC transporter permease [Ktedonobacteraceae bacterium]
MDFSTPAVPVPPASLPASVRPSTAETLPTHKLRKRQTGLPAIYQSCASAWQALRGNTMRSLLTSLGIIIGVSAVIVMISIGESSAAAINQRLAGLSPTEITIRPGSASSGGIRQGAGTLSTLTQADADAIASQVPNVAAVSPVVNASGQAVFGNQNWSTTVQGVYPTYQQIGNWQLQEGSFFTSADEQGDSAVAVIGQTVADNLFTPLGTDPIGQQIRIRNVSFTVVGVLATKGSSGFGNADDIIYVPFSTAQQRLTGNLNVNTVDVQASSTAQVNNVQTAVQQLLEQRHHISNPQQDDFTIQNQSQILQTVQSTSQTLTILLVGVASISLLVGGIGIMNIMLVSVTERTREIGIRMAIGARPRDVMTQFLIEALMLSALGGLVGIALGIGGALAYAFFTRGTFVLAPLSVLLAFGFAASVGVIFGFYPARRAAQLDPIVALRTE